MSTPHLVDVRHKQARVSTVEFSVGRGLNTTLRRSRERKWCIRTPYRAVVMNFMCHSYDALGIRTVPFSSSAPFRAPSWRRAPGRMELSALHRSHERHLRVAWLDETYHPDVYYYDVLRTHLQAFGHSVETRRPPMRAGDASQRKQATGQPVPFSEIDGEARQFDVVLVSFGWMFDENPSQTIRRLPGWQTDTGERTSTLTPIEPLPSLILALTVTRRSLRQRWAAAGGGAQQGVRQAERQDGLAAS